MTPPLIPAVRYLVRSMKLADARKLATKALKLTDPKAIYTLCTDFYQERVRVE
jgi:phosphotransferase system enzyme I (PtsI)